MELPPGQTKEAFEPPPPEPPAEPPLPPLAPRETLQRVVRATVNGAGGNVGGNKVADFFVVGANTSAIEAQLGRYLALPPLAVGADIAANGTGESAPTERSREICSAVCTGVTNRHSAAAVAAWRRARYASAGAGGPRGTCRSRAASEGYHRNLRPRYN